MMGWVYFFFFSSRRRHTRCREVSWARRCVQETVSTQSTWETIKVQDLMGLVKKVIYVKENMPFSEFKTLFSKTKQHYFPVMNQHNRFCGIFSSTDIREVIFASFIEDLVVMRDIMVSDLIVTTPGEDINTVLQKLTIKNIDALPVVKEDDHGTLLGLLYRRDVIAHYNQYLKEMKGR
eukprot:TRINITY_DN59172_c0_g1_i1.p2 TRINITY_DN59172_c0_g1~~TRINITY_DN59172_c0_g1_i1.p2  ORF type:complete len:178 (+),score=58.72 TRINITY_DN59172_c0_g1_i1:52-585(+)